MSDEMTGSNSPHVSDSAESLMSDVTDPYFAVERTATTSTIPAADRDSEPVDENVVLSHKIINEEYKIWKKHAPFLYDLMLSRALDWPTLTTQWFPDKQTPPGEERSIHRLLLGTHTEEGHDNYLQIAHLSIPDFKPDPEDYDEERGEIGGYGGGASGKAKKPTAELKFDIVQKMDHPDEVNKARYMPQNPDLIATMCVDGRSLIYDRTKHPSQPKGEVNPQIELVGHEQEGFGLHWSGLEEGKLATGSSDTTVKLWYVTIHLHSPSRRHKKRLRLKAFEQCPSLEGQD